jgi:hypothetical protein
MLRQVQQSVNRKATPQGKRKTFHFRVLTDSHDNLPFCAKVLGRIPYWERDLG